MPKQNVRALIEYDEKKFLPKILMNQPGYRLVLLNLRAGQAVPEHATKDMVTVYAVAGHVTFYDNQTPIDLKAGEVAWIEGGVPHHLEAHEDSSVLVVAAGNPKPIEEELDLRNVPRPQRHPLVFAKFDGLAVGESFYIVNDHDPMPLHLQMDNMRPEQVSWEYIVRGPEIFRIRVRRVAPPNGREKPFPVPSQTVTGIQAAR